MLDSRPKMTLLDKTKVMSLGHVKAALRSLATFHGSWWFWLYRQRKMPVGINNSIMNWQDIEIAFVTMRKAPSSVFKSFVKPVYKVVMQNFHKAILINTDN